MRKIILSALVLCSFVIGCETKSANDESIESATSGELTIYCEATFMPLMKLEVAAFDSMYKDAHVTILPTTATDAVIDLFTDKTKCTVVGRELNAREEQAAKQYHIDVTKYSIAYSALAVIINKQSKLKSISSDEVRRRLQTKNSALALSPAYSDLYALFSDSMLLAMGKSIGTSDTLPALLKMIKASSNEIGVVEWTSIAHDSLVLSKFSVLDVSGRDSTGKETKSVMLHPAYIYQKTYPLRKTLYGYTTAGNRSLAKGFLAFVTSAPGQRIVTNFGLVTATMPVRLVSPQ